MNTFVDGFGSLHPLLLQNVLIFSGLSKGCSSIVINKGEKSNQLIVGQSVDYLIELDAYYPVLYTIRKKDKKVVYLPSFSGVVLAINGINSNGLVVTQRDTPTGEGKIGIAMGAVARNLLEEVEDLEGARRYLKRIDWPISRSILIAIADSKVSSSSFFEVFPGDEAKELRIPGDYAAAANHYKVKGLFEIQEKALDTCKKLRFICRYDDFLVALNGSLNREKFLENFAQQEKWLSSQKVIEAISYYVPDSSIKIGGQTVSNEATLQAIVFVPEEKVIYMANGMTPPVTQESFVKIKLK